MKFFPTAEGYFNFETGKYVYNYTNHLGNTRLSYFKNGSGAEIIEESNYYPFGLKHEGYNVLSGNTAYKYKYNGKELQESGMYDYGARFYMPEIGRWGVVDPLVESTMDSYGYVWNNPITYIDPTGMSGTSTHTDKFGNVVAAFDDGDLGVYRHSGNAKETKKELDEKYRKNNTAAGGERMGRSLTKYSFTKDGYFDSKGVGNPVGKIDFNDDWNDVEIQWGMNSSNGILHYGMNAGNNGIFDLKSKIEGTEYQGSIMFSDNGDNVYGSRRDAGNFLAGAKAKRSMLPTNLLIYGFGAFNASGNKMKETPSTIVSDIIVGGGLLKSPYYGEDPQSGAAILQGVKYYKKFSNNWFFPDNKSKK